MFDSLGASRGQVQNRLAYIKKGPHGIVEVTASHKRPDRSLFKFAGNHAKSGYLLFLVVVSLLIVLQRSSTANKAPGICSASM